MEINYQLLPYECDYPLSKETIAKVSLKYRGATYNINCSVVKQNLPTYQTLIYRGALYIKNQVISTISQPPRILKYRGVIYASFFLKSTN